MAAKRNINNNSTSTSPRARLLLLLGGLALVAIVEIAFRLGGYGGELSLVVKNQTGMNEVYQINRSAARRYFSGSGISIPEPADETFAVVKTPTTKRIFCIGESTMAGFPYEYNATAPSFLRDRLQAALPSYTIEVVNVGVSAISSFVIADMLDELLRYEPDLIIVYSGHNEFYGAYGAGSAVSAGAPWLTRLHFSLLNFRSYIALRDGLYALASLFATPSDQKHPGTMMQQLAANRLIMPGDPVYETGKNNFSENVSRMIDAATDAGVPILFSALVCNLKDQPPFVSSFSESTPDAVREKVLQRFAEGNERSALGDRQAAVDAFRAASGLDSLYALAHFRVGREMLAAGTFEEARRAFTQARDLDALRFRASSDFEQILTTICTGRRVPLAPIDSAFSKESPEGIPGRELLLEHLHPNVEGYFLMAKVFANTIKESGIIAPRAEWTDDEPDSVLLNRSTVSGLDHAIGKLRIEFLKRQWPFASGPTDYEYRPEGTIEAIAFRYVRREIPWSDARYAAADYYAQTGEFDKARNECEAVSKIIPHSYNPVFRIAEYYRMEGKRDEAKAAFQRSLTIENNPYARMKLGLIALEMRDSKEAEQQLSEAIAVNRTFPESFTIEMSSAANYLLGVAQARQGKFTEARAAAQRALAIQPGNREAEYLLQQLDTLSTRY